MPPAFTLLALASTVACTSVAFLALVSPAMAQDRVLWLEDNEQAAMAAYLLEGESVYATCDQDCSDLDLFLYNDLGAMVASDDELDSFPMVVAPYEGDFMIEVTMPSCPHSAGCSVSVSSDYSF
ncbi:MAG: hypothetical protein WA885_14030 [Phormidesmis sp.]